jgi:hypothetical protein
MPDPKYLRELAAGMLAVATKTRDQQLARNLARRAADYLDQAKDMEKAGNNSQGRKKHS